ncbi:LysR substrate-binding domain-containing protein [Usitatibacter palustris]|uniref:HTH-type transcriptional regulator CynR n=1 Tax=Usitatibacter palustris TaxID=2732487 RepID=A0A6M4H3R3_9PROT|nr:LysR substrate-binding domain-containing protein [Usitatibacter palustris]QJR13718.1 HTH-type transcriptional regulator CynR [Usitatibacter palustris]
MADIRQLRYFVRIVEAGSFLAASRAIHIAQPALSQQLANLEAELGVILLRRSSRGVTPTEPGRALYDHARFLLRQFDQLGEIVRRPPGEVRGSVSLGVAPTTVAALGLDFLKHLRTRFPGVVLTVVEGLSGHVAELARLGQLDLAILFGPVEGMIAEPLLDEELFVIAHRTSKLVPARRKRMSLAEAAALPMILPTGTHGLRRRIALELERAGLRANLVAEIDSLPLLMASVREDLAATIQPWAATRVAGSRPDDWRVIPVTDATLRRRNYLGALPGDRLSPAAAAVRDELREVVVKLVRRNAWCGVTLADLLEQAA